MGIDPGTVTTGYGVIERRAGRIIHRDNGLIVPPKRRELHDRLKFIYAGLVAVLAEFQPDVVAVESIFAGKNVRSALYLGHARGVILLAAAQSGAEVFDYSPALIKKTVTGRGRADKFQVQMMVKALLGLPEVPAEDAADALAMSICHCHHETEISIRDRIAARPGRRQSG